MGDYNIGTKAGNDIAETLKKNLGTSTTVKDGSSWTADKSGNIWVTKDGVTTKANITYQPPNTGSGGSGGSGGGGSRNPTPPPATLGGVLQSCGTPGGIPASARPSFTAWV